jgi:hypothetical protein
MTISPTQELIDEMRHGRMIVLADAEDRENEGDLVLAADFVTPEAINFMATHARGSSASRSPRSAAASWTCPHGERQPLAHGHRVSPPPSRRRAASPPASPAPIARAPCAPPPRKHAKPGTSCQPGTSSR